MTTTKTAAEERYTGHDLEQIQVCEEYALPFTSAELDVIDSYLEASAGTEDCFDIESHGGDLIWPDDFARSSILAMIEAHFRMLSDWYDQISVLEDQLHKAAGEDRSPSSAAGNFIGGQLLAWSCAREGYRSAVLEYFLGRDKFGYRFDQAHLPDGFRYDDGQCWLPF